MMPQYQKCPGKETLFKYALNEHKIEQSAQDHFGQCQKCLDEIHTIKAMNHHVQMTPRPLPSKKSLKNYHKTLKQSMQGIQHNKPSTHFMFRPAFIASFSAICIFVLGIWMGKTFWRSSSSNSTQLSTIEQLQTQRMNHYLEQSEIWLLTVMNQSDSEQSQWKAEDRLLTQQLLQQTYQVGRESDFFNNPLLLPFIEQIETMLLEIANADSSEIENTFTLIRNAVENRQLLLQSQNIQKELAESNNLNLSRL